MYHQNNAKCFCTVPHCRHIQCALEIETLHRPAQPLEGSFLCLVKYNLTVCFNLSQVPSYQHLLGKKNKDLALQANVFQRASIIPASWLNIKIINHFNQKNEETASS